MTNGLFYTPFFLEMGSINVDLFWNLSAAALIIKIWDFSEHVHHKPPLDPSTCNCQYYLDCCIADKFGTMIIMCFLIMLYIDFNTTENNISK